MRDLSGNDAFFVDKKRQVKTVFIKKLSLVGMPVKNILLVDDHLVVRTGMKVILQDYYSQLRLLEAGDGETALQILK